MKSLTVISIFYCPSIGNYTAYIANKAFNSRLNLITDKVSANRNFYKYSLPNSLNENHWFHGIVSEKKPYTTTLRKGVSLVPAKEYLSVKLYNFNTKSTTVIISVDGKDNICESRVEIM